MIIAELFRSQCRPWKEVITEYLDEILRVVYRVINEIIEQISVGETTEGILRDIINPRWISSRRISKTRLPRF